MASFIDMLKFAIAELDRDPDTFQAYAFWVRKFYGFIRKPASQWTGPDGRALPVVLPPPRIEFETSAA